MRVRKDLLAEWLGSGAMLDSDGDDNDMTPGPKKVIHYLRM